MTKEEFYQDLLGLPQPWWVERVVLDGIGSVRARVSAGSIDGLAATSEDGGANGDSGAGDGDR